MYVELLFIYGTTTYLFICGTDRHWSMIWSVKLVLLVEFRNLLFFVTDFVSSCFSAYGWFTHFGADSGFDCVSGDEIPFDF